MDSQKREDLEKILRMLDDIYELAKKKRTKIYDRFINIENYIDQLQQRRNKIHELLDK